MTTDRARFLRDNAFLIAAVSLPLLVVGFFLLATAIPRWTVPPPAYDLLLRSDMPQDGSVPRVAVEYRVQDGRIEAIARPVAANSYVVAGSLWLFDHTTMTVSRVAVDLPTLAEGDAPRTIPIPALAGRKVVSDSKAPDGYELQSRDHSGSGLVGDIFGMRRYDRGVSLVNRGRVVPIRLPPPHEYYYGVHPVGWVIE